MTHTPVLLDPKSLAVACSCGELLTYPMGVLTINGSHAGLFAAHLRDVAARETVPERRPIHAWNDDVHYVLTAMGSPLCLDLDASEPVMLIGFTTTPSRIQVTCRDCRERLGMDRWVNERARLDLAKKALVDTGYFTEDEVGDDIAPRIHELWAHYGGIEVLAYDTLRGLIRQSARTVLEELEIEDAKTLAVVIGINAAAGIRDHLRVMRTSQ